MIIGVNTVPGKAIERRFCEGIPIIQGSTDLYGPMLFLASPTVSPIPKLYSPIPNP